MTDMLLGLFIGGVLGVVAHEAGHAAMALVTGLRLRAITIGCGRTLFAGEYRAIGIRLNSIPLSGRVAIFPEIYQRKTTLLMFAFGGVAANILLGLGVLLLWRSGILPGTLHRSVTGFYYVQAFLIVWNLIPQTRTFDGEVVHNDGKVILSILESSHGSLSPVAQMYLLLLAPYTNGKDPLSTFSPASQRLMTYTHLKHHGHFDRRNREDLFRKLLAELGKGELSPEEELLVLDGLVTDAVITGDPEAKTHIDEWSRRSMLLGPNVKTLRFSRAAALIELGRFAEGKALVEASAGPDDKPFDALLNNTFLARAEAGLGNLERAGQLLFVASQLIKTVDTGRLRNALHVLIEETGKRIKKAAAHA